MPVDLSLLGPAFQRQVLELLEACLARGIEMRPYCAVRSPLEQARLWRQGRTRQEIERKIATLREQGAPYLADCIECAGPQHGRQVTNAIPGLSWHQWGEAVDCFWVVNGDANWSTTETVNGLNGYRVYTEEALLLGLHAGGRWALADWPHVQLRRAPSPLGEMALKAVDAEMRRRFPA